MHVSPTQTQHPRASSTCKVIISASGKPPSPEIPRSHLLSCEGSMVTGCRQAFIIDVLDDSTCNTCPQIPDKLHHAFAGPLGIKGFDIQSHPIKKLDYGKPFPSHWLLLLRLTEWWGLPHFPHWDIDRGVGSSSRPAQRGSAGANEYGWSLTELSVIIKFAVCVLDLMAISYLISRNGPDRLSYSGFEDRGCNSRHVHLERPGNLLPFLSREIEVTFPSRECLHADAKSSCDKTKQNNIKELSLRLP
jgi:hypothetical protein